MMNSYIRQTPIPADQMHSFLKDKQAWENAIGMYLGPDPLDHWYNYVCWYENHGHGDPENKFRETLERCLTLFEHNEFYRQDPRMTRLWLKYIDMQSNPLHFYQVLYQRGVGRQLAAFYVSWAGYYESVQAAKEAESVYNLGFQEKAQPYVELHHAYNKFVYTRQAAAAAALQQQQQQAQVQAQQQQQQQKTAVIVSSSHHQQYAAATAVSAAASLHHGQHQVSQTQSYRQTHHVTTATATYAAAQSAPQSHLQQQHPTPQQQPQPQPPPQQHHLYHQQQHVSYQSPQTHHTTTTTHALHTHTNHQHPHPHHQQLQHQHQQQHPTHLHPLLHHQHTLQHSHHSQPTQTQTHMPSPSPQTQQQQQHATNTQHDHQLATTISPTQTPTQPQSLHQHQHQPQQHTLHHHHHIHQQQQLQQQTQQLARTLNHHHNQHNHHQNHNHNHLHHNQNPHHLQTQPQHATTEADGAVAPTISHYHLQHQQQHQQQQQPHLNGSATSGAIYQEQQQQQQQQATTQVQQEHFERVQHEMNSSVEAIATVGSASTTSNTPTTPDDASGCRAPLPLANDDTSILSIRLPRRFAAYCRNNYETWKPALFLEEPADPCRRCHYAKNLVYPGDGCEYSPEELRIQRYANRIETLRQQEDTQLQQQQQQQVQLQAITTATSDDALSHEPPFEGFYSHEQQRQPHHQPHPVALQQQHYALNGSNQYHNMHESEQESSEENGDDEYEQDDYEATNDADEEQDEEEEDGEEYNEDADGDGDGDGDGDEPTDDRHTTQYQMLQRQQQQEQFQQQQYNHIVEDVEDQIEASTIRLSENKTIKIKFRKERSQLGDSYNGSSNYSAYTIENIYQHEIASPTSLEEQVTRRNGHSFHPYIIGQTSTPKTSVKRSSKAKLKRASKYQQAITCISSNSSSTENAPLSNAHVIDHLQHGTAAKATTLAASNGVINGGGSGTSGNGGSAATISHDQTIQNANYNDNANYSFLSAAALENSNCSLTSAVDRLNFRDTSVLGNHASTTNNNTTTNNNNTNNNVADFSTYQENSYFATQHDTEAKERRLQKALETIERHLARDAIDPFNSELCRAFLTKLDFPGAEEATHTNYKIIQTPLPKIANSRALTLPDGLHFSVDKEVGRGSYGSVYKATDVNSGAVVALKFQKPPNTWEIYICDQVLKRVKSPNVLPGLMDVSTAIIAPNASLIATEFSPFGSLLDINNKIRQNTSKVMHESLVMHFAAQICNIIHHLHRQHIIHADIKPDNFLLMRIPNTDLHYPSLRLIDFGCAIDMTLFPQPEQTKFRKVIQTDGFTCIEMQEGRPWSYETDLFCIAGTVHVMLMGEYMQLQKRAGIWDIKQKLPRYLKKHVWTKFFGGMLNIRNGSKLPDLCELRDIFDEEAAKMDSELQKQIRTLSNILYRR